MAMLDVFNADAFSVVSLTDSVNKLKFVPGYISSLGLFQESSASTTSIVIEEKDGILSLVSPSPRGGPGSTLDKSRRVARSVVIPHFQLDDAIMADEIQGVRAWGSETETEMMMAKVAERATILRQSMAATQEYSRVGAIKGVVTYANGDTLDLFSLFGVSQNTEIDFNLDAASPVDGDLRELVEDDVLRAMMDNLDGVPLAGVRAICGNAFFDALMKHNDVLNSMLAAPEAAKLRQAYVTPGGMVYGSFEFAGVIWENYRGSVGGQAFVDTDKVHFYPVGVPGMFRTVYGPADYIETVNRPGQPSYTKQYEMPNGKGIYIEHQMNSLEYCTRPKALIKGKRT